MFDKFGNQDFNKFFFREIAAASKTEKNLINPSLICREILLDPWKIGNSNV